MNKIEFKGLDKEQMVIAFNQLKDDYHNVFEEKESLRSILKEIREYIKENKDKYYQDWGGDDGSCDTYLDEEEINKLLEIIDKGIGGE